jgi:hypothetical protein
VGYIHFCKVFAVRAFGISFQASLADSFCSAFLGYHPLQVLEWGVCSQINGDPPGYPTRHQCITAAGERLPVVLN